jgi:hypothetical protein
MKMARKIWYTKDFAALAATDAGLPRWGIEEWTDRYGVTAYAIREPTNPDLHDHLTALGYDFDPMPAEFDDGDPENGPGTGGHPPYDQYIGPDEFIMIEDGHVVHRAARDLDLERWIDGMNSVECDGISR